MAKAPSSVIGLDLGRYALKSVLLQKKSGDRLVVTHYASQAVNEPADSAAALGKQIKALFKEMGGSAKVCAVGVSSPEAIIRIIDQPETPVEILRDALRFNGMSLLNQDCRSFVLDCDRIPTPPNSAEMGVSQQRRYLVGGLPRTQVSLVGDALVHLGAEVGTMQLSPICAFNAFEFAYPEVFNNEAFFLVDVGHTSSTMMVGAKRELMLVRNIDFGGKLLIEALTGMSGEGRLAVFQALEQEDEVMMEFLRVSMGALIREIQNSIGFLEHQREEIIRNVFVSGGPAKSQTFLKVLGEELHVPCESWSAAAKCESALPAERAATFARDSLDLNVACGAAAEFLQN